jgi:hypothetical protein
MRLPGRWVWLTMSGAAVAGVALGLVVSGVRWPGSGGRSLPPSRARVYENVDACLLTGARGVADPAVAQVWAGMEDASRATTARMSVPGGDRPGHGGAGGSFPRVAAGERLPGDCGVGCRRTSGGARRRAPFP